MCAKREINLYKLCIELCFSECNRFLKFLIFIKYFMTIINFDYIEFRNLNSEFLLYKKKHLITETHIILIQVLSNCFTNMSINKMLLFS